MDGAVAELRDRGKLVRDEDHRAPRAAELLHAAEAPPLELGVAHGQHLVHEEDLRLEMSGDRERRRTYMPLEYRFTGVSMNFSTPENSTIASKRSSISRRFIPRIAPFR